MVPRKDFMNVELALYMTVPSRFALTIFIPQRTQCRHRTGVNREGASD
jgi:hypothetical protein